MPDCRYQRYRYSARPGRSNEQRGPSPKRERRARVILGTAETEIAEKFEQASKKYTDNPVALHLRGMNMLFEGLKEKGSMVIVPSSALDTMNLGAMGGLVSLAKNNETPK